MRPDVIARLLPELYQRSYGNEGASNPLDALIHVMASLHETTETYLDDPEKSVEPWRCDERFLNALASWVGLSKYLDSSKTTSIADLRELTTRAAGLARNRGTRESLIELLELLTGATGFTIIEQVRDDRGRTRPYHFCVDAPRSSLPYRDLIERIVMNEKPCYTTVEIRFKES